MSNKLKHALTHPIPIPVSHNGKSGALEIDTVMVQPRVLIRAAAELLIMLAGDDPKEVETKIRSKIVLPNEK